MNDAFRITVHWAERIIELRCPRAPSVAAFERCSGEIRTAVARMTGAWKVLVDHREVEQIPEGLIEALRDTILWATAHRLEKAARVTTPGSEFDELLRKLGPEADLPGAASLPCADRDEAWAALTEPPTRVTPGEMKAVGAAGTLRR